MMQDITVDKAELISEVQRLVSEGCRFGTATCLDEGEEFEVIYHFERELEMVNLRVKLRKDEALPSISGVLLAASLIENEMEEMFSIDIAPCAIDYKGGLLLAKESPQKPLIKPEEKEG
jgi:NADH:ubiquinone oxidoreductase subunit C